MNWSKRAIIETPTYSKKSKPLRRFLQITRFLYFANNNVTDNNDKLHDLRLVINNFNEKIKRHKENIMIDESSMKFRRIHIL